MSRPTTALLLPIPNTVTCPVVVGGGPPRPALRVPAEPRARPQSRYQSSRRARYVKNRRIRRNLRSAPPTPRPARLHCCQLITEPKDRRTLRTSTPGPLLFIGGTPPALDTAQKRSYDLGLPLS